MRPWFQRVFVIGHLATRWGLDHALNGTPVEDLIAADAGWQAGWEYRYKTQYPGR